MRLSIFLGLLLYGSQLAAQYHSFGFGAGSSAFRGETTKDRSLFEEAGINLYGYYSYWLADDERWQLVAQARLDYINGRREGLASDADYSYQANSFLLSPLAGIRFYADRDIRDYVPEKWQGGLFLGLYAGAAVAYSDYRIPQVIDPASPHYKASPTITFNSMFEIGYRMFWNQFWAYEISLGLQHGFNDRWDGFKGNTTTNDFVTHISVGATYSFYAFR